MLHICYIAENVDEFYFASITRWTNYGDIFVGIYGSGIEILFPKVCWILFIDLCFVYV